MRNAIIFIVALAAIRLAVAWFYPLLPDEAYYWVWSRELAFGYFDHPPMVAWVVRAGTFLLGNSHLGVRLFFVILSAGTGFLAYLLIRELSDDRRGFQGLLAGTALLLLGIGGLLAVPDVPLIFFWALGLFAGIKALRGPCWWLVYGMSLGGALLSKYTGVFLLLLPLAYLFTERGFIRKWQLWVGLVIAAAIFMPNLAWNASHDWVSFTYQLGHGLGKGLNPYGPLKYIADAALVNSLFLFVLLVWGAIKLFKRLREPATFALSLLFWVPFLFFWALALRGSGEANWPAPAYMSLVSLGVLGLRDVRSWFWKASVGFGLALVALTHAQAIRSFLPIRGDPTEKARGWQELAMCVDEVTEKYPGLPVAAGSYQEASELSFYLAGNPLVRVANPGGRPNQITLAHPAKPGEDFIFIGEPDGFSETERLLEFKGLRHYYNVYIAKGYLSCRY